MAKHPDMLDVIMCCDIADPLLPGGHRAVPRPPLYYDGEFPEVIPASQHCCCLNFLVKRWGLV